MTKSIEPIFSFPLEAGVKARPLRAVIKLASLKKNLTIIKNNIGSSHIIVVVKADAYGHGLVEIAQSSGDHCLAVAVPEELTQLREAGLQNQVWVLEGPFTVNCLVQADNNVVWVIHSFWQIELIKHALRQGLISGCTICIKLDTGMHRLGFVESELELLQTDLESLPQVSVNAIMTHFSMSDYPKHKSVVEQITKFDELVCDHNWGGFKQTLANSGGVMNYPQSHRDWVRPGIMLYSGESSASEFSDLEPVMSFESAIISLRCVKQGESVGYGETWVAEKDSTIATVAVGYADGYPRHAPSGTPVAIIGQESREVSIVSLVGRVSMDMITVDVSSIAQVAIGDRVELWGDIIAVGDVAALSGAISYELLTSVSKRVPRVYKS